jgi:serine/threonine protein kinase
VVSPPQQLRSALADRYRLERELGQGGMATVYLAHDLRHDRPVALKVLHSELAVTLGAERFQREIKLAARLQHPHILTVLDSGAAGEGGAGGVFWFTMPFVEGETLRTRLAREGQLPIPDAIRIIREAADALATPTSTASFTAISSPRTSSSPAPTPSSRTSASPGRSAPTPRRSSLEPASRSAPRRT